MGPASLQLAAHRISESSDSYLPSNATYLSEQRH